MSHDRSPIPDDERDAFIADWNANSPVDTMARKYDLTHAGVLSRRKMLRLTPRRHRPDTIPPHLRSRD